MIEELMTADVGSLSDSEGPCLLLPWALLGHWVSWDTGNLLVDQSRIWILLESQILSSI